LGKWVFDVGELFVLGVVGEKSSIIRFVGHLQSLVKELVVTRWIHAIKEVASVFVVFS
jgi:hypothetical protein